MDLVTLISRVHDSTTGSGVERYYRVNIGQIVTFLVVFHFYSSDI